jgi:hypothetical protein
MWADIQEAGLQSGLTVVAVEDGRDQSGDTTRMGERSIAGVLWAGRREAFLFRLPKLGPRDGRLLSLEELRRVVKPASWSAWKPAWPAGGIASGRGAVLEVSPVAVSAYQSGAGAAHRPAQEPHHAGDRGEQHYPAVDPLRPAQVLPAGKEGKSDNQRPDYKGRGEQVPAGSEAIHQRLVVVRTPRQPELAGASRLPMPISNADRSMCGGTPSTSGGLQR